MRERLLVVGAGDFGRAQRRTFVRRCSLKLPGGVD